MGKPLEEMTLEELWRLFPIQLSSYNPQYAQWYLEKKREVEQSLLPVTAFSMHHIGSTAVPGLWAKPIVDMLMELPMEAPGEELVQKLVDSGWICMSASSSPWRRSLNWGYTPEGFGQKVFHLHIRRQGDHDELYFRDYLLAHPEIASAYEALKRGLAEQYRFDRDAYTRQKTAFVQRYTQEGKREFAGRYEDRGKQ